MVIKEMARDKIALMEKREELVEFVNTFKQAHDIDAFSVEELDLWIERLRPVRMELRAIDDALRELGNSPFF